MLEHNSVQQCHHSASSYSGQGQRWREAEVRPAALAGGAAGTPRLADLLQLEALDVDFEHLGVPDAVSRHERRLLLADLEDQAPVGRAPDAERLVARRRPRQRDHLLQPPLRRVGVLRDRVVVEIGFAAGVVEVVREHADLPVRGLHDGDVLLPVAGRRGDDGEGELHGARVEHEPPVGEAVHPVEAAVRVVPPVPDGVHRAAERRPVAAPDEAIRRRERAPPPVARGEGEGGELPQIGRAHV